VWILVQHLLPKRNSQSWEPNRKAVAYESWNMSVRLWGRCRLTDKLSILSEPRHVRRIRNYMWGGSAITTLTQKRAVFPAFSLREVTLGQVRKIGIHFIIYLKGSYPGASSVQKFMVSGHYVQSLYFPVWNAWIHFFSLWLNNKSRWSGCLF